jgi:hypothetical protein
MHCARCFFYETNVGDDVCNRCGRSYLPEANVYLGLLALVTGGSAWALRFILTGATDPFIRPALELGAWVTWPVSIVDRPLFGLIMGVWLGMLAAAPLLAGMLYGKRGGWLLVIVEAVFGPSLILAAVTALGVWVAAGWTVRLQSKLASALLGLAPIILYWFVATAMTDFGKGDVARPMGMTEFGLGSVTLGSLPPALRSMAYVLPVIASITAVAVSLLVVLIGWTDRWHVRWTASVASLAAVGPVLAMVALVGIDEIRYGYLRASANVTATGDVVPTDELYRLQEFLHHYPKSSRVPLVAAQLATEIEPIETNLRPGPAPGRSLDAWQTILVRHESSPWAADARLHLGDAAARQSRFKEAEEEFYRKGLSITLRQPPPTDDPLSHFSVIWDLFSIGPQLLAREEAQHLAAVQPDLQMHLALILENHKKDSPESDRALAQYFVALELKGTDSYHEALARVTEIDPKGPLADNVACDLALMVPDDLKRLEALQQVIAAWPGTDGAMLARLGAAATLVARAASERAAWSQAQKYLKEVEDELARRKAANPADIYAQALKDSVQKKVAYVDSQLRSPGEGQ